MSVVNEKKNKLVKKLIVPTLALGIFEVGKTTLLKVIAWILHKDEGNIFFDTKEIFSTKESFHSLAFFCK